MGFAREGRTSGRRRAARPVSDINVTPLVDVMLVLLIVFMVTAPMLTTGVPIDLPKSDARPITSQDDKPIEISINKDGTIYVGETRIEQAKLLPLLSSITGSDSEQRIFLRADSGLDYGLVMKVLGEVNGAGYKKVALITNPSK